MQGFLDKTIKKMLLSILNFFEKNYILGDANRPLGVGVSPGVSHDKWLPTGNSGRTPIGTHGGASAV